MAHGFIPHEHHSFFSEPEHLCDHNHNLQEIDSSCSLHHNHNHHKSHKCSFSDITVLTKFVKLTNFFIPSSEIEIVAPEEIIQPGFSTYLHIQITEPHCRDLSLRGPPQLS
jgi:hypothetical protein